MAIQYTFGWFGYHLHEFSVVDQNYKAEEGTPLYAYPKKIRIVDGEDPEVEQFLERDRYEVKYDTKTSLREIFEETDRCIYTLSLIHIQMCIRDRAVSDRRKSRLLSEGFRL